MVHPQAGARRIAPGIAGAAGILGQLLDQHRCAAASVPGAGRVAALVAGAGHAVVARVRVAAVVRSADQEHASATAVDPELAVAHAEVAVFDAAGFRQLALQLRAADHVVAAVAQAAVVAFALQGDDLAARATSRRGEFRPATLGHGHPTVGREPGLALGAARAGQLPGQARLAAPGRVATALAAVVALAADGLRARRRVGAGIAAQRLGDVLLDLAEGPARQPHLVQVEAQLVVRDGAAVGLLAVFLRDHPGLVGRAQGPQVLGCIGAGTDLGMRRLDQGGGRDGESEREQQCGWQRAGHGGSRVVDGYGFRTRQMPDDGHFGPQAVKMTCSRPAFPGRMPSSPEFPCVPSSVASSTRP